MSKWKRTANSLEDLPEIAKQLLADYSQDRIFAFYGEMGAGKTTFIKELCHQLGIENEVSSPTFSIVNEYFDGKESLYHFDFYRINNVQEAFDIGAEEYFYSGSYCFLEWPQKIEALLPEESIKVHIKEISISQREFTINRDNI